MYSISAHNAKQSFGKLIELSRRRPVAIKRYKRPVAYMISAHDFAEFRTLRKRAVKAEIDTLLDDMEASDIGSADFLILKLPELLRRAEKYTSSW